MKDIKILFLASSRFDYLQDLTFSGLAQVLKKDQLYCNPITKWDYFLYEKKYPKNLSQFDHRFSYFHLNIPWHKITHVIIGSCKKDCLENFLKIEKKLQQGIKTVFLDGSDWPDIAGDAQRLKIEETWKQVNSARSIDYIFKREMIKERTYPDNVFPFPFSVHSLLYQNINIEKKIYDVSFWGVESDPIRTKALEILNNKFDCKDNGTELNQDFSKYQRKGEFYLEELKRCKICLNFRGGGWDTLRLWELAGLGVFTISQKMGILIPDFFTDGKDIVYCQDDLSDLEEKCQYYLIHEDEREEIAYNFKKKAYEYHTNIHRAEYLIKSIL
jgi:hypothetical protein